MTQINSAMAYQNFMNRYCLFQMKININQQIKNSFSYVKNICWFCFLQSESGRDTKRGVAADLRAEGTNIAAGAKTEGAAAERNGAGAETGRAGTAAVPHGTTRSTGQRLEAAEPQLLLLLTLKL